MGATLRAAGLLAATLALAACGAGEAPEPAAPAEAADAGLSAEQQAQMEQLLAIGYVQATDTTPQRQGVALHVVEAAQPGVNLVVSAHAPEARLVDMAGRELHRWQRSFGQVWPGREPHPRTVFHKSWRRAHPLPGGELLVIFEEYGLVKLDRDSNVLWVYDAAVHHDLHVAADGSIRVLIRGPRQVILDGWEREIVEDFVAVLDAHGREQRRVSLYDAVASSFYARWLRDAREEDDIFHTNSIEILDGQLASLSDDFRAGNALVSIHGLHAVAVVDLDAERVVWGLRGDWRLQHEARALASGRILLFDNLGKQHHSRVLELDPLTGEVLWSYEDAEPGAFESLCCGTNQRLENGNTLITDAAKGRAFELDPWGGLVWEYWSPHRVLAADGSERVATLFEVRRLPEDWLPDAG